MDAATQATACHSPPFPALQLWCHHVVVGPHLSHWETAVKYRDTHDEAIVPSCKFTNSKLKKCVCTSIFSDSKSQHIKDTQMDMMRCVTTVSYTHLTLPTNREV